MKPFAVLLLLVLVLQPLTLDQLISSSAQAFRLLNDSLLQDHNKPSAPNVNDNHLPDPLCTPSQTEVQEGGLAALIPSLVANYSADRLNTAAMMGVAAVNQTSPENSTNPSSLEMRDDNIMPQNYRKTKDYSGGTNKEGGSAHQHQNEATGIHADNVIMVNEQLREVISPPPGVAADPVDKENAQIEYQRDAKHAVVVHMEDVIIVNEQLRDITPPPGGIDHIHTAATGSVSQTKRVHQPPAQFPTTTTINQSRAKQAIAVDDVIIVNEQLRGYTPPPGDIHQIHTAARVHQPPQSSITATTNRIEAKQAVVVHVDDVIIVNEQLRGYTPPPGDIHHHNVH